MKQLFFALMMLIGWAGQAQSFDFECETLIGFSNPSPAFGDVNLTTGNNTSLKVNISNVPSGGYVQIRRRIGNNWANDGTTLPTNGSYTILTPSNSNEVTYEYRFQVYDADNTLLDSSGIWKVIWKH